MYKYHIFYIHLFADGHTGHCQDLAIINFTAINMSMSVSLKMMALTLSGRFLEGEQLSQLPPLEQTSGQLYPQALQLQRPTNHIHILLSYK